jgi:ATP-binding cassette, subfamily B, bacterial
VSGSAGAGNGSGAQRSSALSSLRSVLRQHRGAATALILGSFLAGVSESVIIALVAHTALALVDGVDSVSASLGPFELDARLPVVLAVAGVLGLGRLVLSVGIAYLPARMAGHSQVRMRSELFEAYTDASWDVQAEERDGHLQELLSNQVVQATQAMLQATTLASSGLIFLTLVIAAFTLHPVVALLVVVVAAVLAALLRPLGRWGRRASHDFSQAQLDYAEGIGQAVQMAEETYTFGAAEAQREQVASRAEAARSLYQRAHFALRLTTGLYQGVVILLLIGGLASLYAAGTVGIASLGAVVLVLLRASSYGQQAQAAWHAVEQAGPFLERLAVARDRYRANPPPRGQESFPAAAGLHLEGVSFAYRNAVRVLDGVDLDIRPGEVVGVAGSSGAGKSTLVQILLRMRIPTAGTVRIDGVPVQDISLEEWRRRVAYVPQEPRLFHATVADNIRFARPLDDDRVEAAARMAHIHEAIEAMPHGYDTVVGQRADAVSGGQRQRLCLARALAGDPEMLVLDEPTSALDAASEVAIRASLRELRGRITMIIVTHRPSLLEICDQVVHIEAGRAQAGPARDAADPGA